MTDGLEQQTHNTKMHGTLSRMAAKEREKIACEKRKMKHIQQKRN